MLSGYLLPVRYPQAIVKWDDVAANKKDSYRPRKRPCNVIQDAILGTKQNRERDVWRVGYLGLSGYVVRISS